MANVVVIGGGTGNYRVLNGLKHYPIDLTAIVAMSDTGGSTGRLREEFGILPPGDLNNCVVALSRNSENEWLFRYRYQTNGNARREVGGHSLGNLMITAFFEHYGIMNGLKKVEKYLDVHERNRVLPVTLEDIQLKAVYSDGSEVIGETKIDKPNAERALPIKEAFLLPSDCYICKESEDALNNADAIVIGPGDLYTSIIPNFLVKRLNGKKMLENIHGKKIFVCNVMTKYGETSGKNIGGGRLIYKARDFVRDVERYAGAEMDYVVCNNKKLSSKELEERYIAEGSHIVENDLNDNRVVLDELVSEGEFYRHDSLKLARCLMRIIDRR